MEKIDDNVAEHLSLRDWFAGEALSGIAACFHKMTYDSLAEIAWDAYRLADLMLKAREGNKDSNVYSVATWEARNNHKYPGTAPVYWLEFSTDQTTHWHCCMYKDAPKDVTVIVATEEGLGSGK